MVHSHSHFKIKMPKRKHLYVAHIDVFTIKSYDWCLCWHLKRKLPGWGISLIPEHKDREALYFRQAWQGATWGAMKRGASWARPPQRQPAAGLTLWKLHRNLPWQRKQPLLRWTFIKTEPGHTHTRADLGSEPCQSSPPCNPNGGILGKCKVFFTFWSSKCSPCTVVPHTGQPCQQSVSLTFILSCFSKCKNVHY